MDVQKWLVKKVLKRRVSSSKVRDLVITPEELYSFMTDCLNVVLFTVSAKHFLL